MVTYIVLIYAYSCLCILSHFSGIDSSSPGNLLFLSSIPTKPQSYQLYGFTLTIVFVANHYISLSIRQVQLSDHGPHVAKNKLQMGPNTKIKSLLKYCQIAFFFAFFDKSTALISKLNFIDDNTVTQCQRLGHIWLWIVSSSPNMWCDFNESQAFAALSIFFFFFCFSMVKCILCCKSVFIKLFQKSLPISDDFLFFYNVNGFTFQI